MAVRLARFASDLNLLPRVKTLLLPVILVATGAAITKLRGSTPTCRLQATPGVYSTVAISVRLIIIAPVRHLKTPPRQAGQITHCDSTKLAPVPIKHKITVLPCDTSIRPTSLTCKLTNNACRISCTRISAWIYSITISSVSISPGADKQTGDTLKPACTRKMWTIT